MLLYSNFPREKFWSGWVVTTQCGMLQLGNILGQVIFLAISLAHIRLMHMWLPQSWTHVFDSVTISYSILIKNKGYPWPLSSEWRCGHSQHLVLYCPLEQEGNVITQYAVSMPYPIIIIIANIYWVPPYARHFSDHLNNIKNLTFKSNFLNFIFPIRALRNRTCPTVCIWWSHN